MSNFDAALAYVLRNEKELSNHPNDKGKITNHGISYGFLKSLSSESLRKYAIFEEVCEQTLLDLRLEQAVQIYHDEFWLAAPFERIDNQEQVDYIFDMAISMGVAPAIKCVQRACWAVQKKRELVDDGVLGAKTLIAIRMCGFLLSAALRSERAGYYRLVVKEQPLDEVFFQGWLNRAYECDR